MSGAKDKILRAMEAEAVKTASAVASPSATALAIELAQLEEEEEKIEADLAKNKSAQHVIRTRKLPDVMAEMQQKEFKIAEGQYHNIKVVVDDFVAGSLPKDEEKRKIAIQYLEEHDGSGLIKDVLVIDIPKPKEGSNAGTAAQLPELIQAIENLGFIAVRSSDVNHMSLKAYGTERLRKGEPLEPEKIGLFVGRSVKLTWPRAKKIK